MVIPVRVRPRGRCARPPRPTPPSRVSTRNRLPGTGGRSAFGSQRRWAASTVMAGSAARFVHSWGRDACRRAPPSRRRSGCSAMLGADGVVALLCVVMAGHGAGRSASFNCGSRLCPSRPCAAAGRTVDQRRIEVEQLGRLAALRAARDAGPGEDQRHVGRALPERVLAGDALFAQVPAVVATRGRRWCSPPGRSLSSASSTRPTWLSMKLMLARYARTSGRHWLGLLQPRQPRLRQLPVQIPGELRHVGAVVVLHRRQHQRRLRDSRSNHFCERSTARAASGSRRARKNGRSVGR